MNRTRLLDRFLQYVKIDTTASETSETYPSTPGQLEIGKLLVQQMQAMGIADAAQDEFGIVVGTIPGNVTACLLYTSPSPRDRTRSRMPSSA